MASYTKKVATLFCRICHADGTQVAVALSLVMLVSVLKTLSRKLFRRKKKDKYIYEYTPCGVEEYATGFFPLVFSYYSNALSMAAAVGRMKLPLTQWETFFRNATWFSCLKTRKAAMTPHVKDLVHP